MALRPLSNQYVIPPPHDPLDHEITDRQTDRQTELNTLLKGILVMSCYVPPGLMLLNQRIDHLETWYKSCVSKCYPDATFLIHLNPLFTDLNPLFTVRF